MRVLYLFLFVFFFQSFLSAQQVQRCYSTEIHEATYQADANYRHEYDTRKVLLDEIMEESLSQGRLDCVVPIIIPVAVHYEGITTQSLSCLTDLALSQIQTLNEDYSATNSDISNFDEVVSTTEMIASYLAAEGVCVQFCLADADHPAGFGLDDGDYAITINQNYVANGNFPNFTNGVWSGYINIFVTEGTGVLGYSPLFGGGNGSGVVIEACAFGVSGNGCGNGVGPGTGCGQYSQYNLGRTATHEVGHYLGLNHIWGPGNSGCTQDDGFTDTPASFESYFGCPNIGVSTCSSADMHMNYMDYVDDACMYMFSEQQANLMYNTASSIWGTDSPKCSTAVTEDDAGIEAIIFPSGQACGTTVAPVVQLRNIGTNNLTSVEIIYNAGGTGDNVFNWTGNLVQNEIELVNLPSVSSPSVNYTLDVATNNPNGMADENPTNDSKSVNVNIIDGVELPFFEDVESFSAPFPAQGIEIFNPDNDAYAWTRRPGVSGFGNGVYAVFFDNLNATNAEGKEDWFILPEFNVTGFNSVNLTYDLAYTYFEDGGDSRYDSLAIMYSLGCSNDWQQVSIDGGASLATATPMTSQFLASASDWTDKSIGINTNGSNFLRIAFVNKSGRGNSMFLDNINVEGSTAIVSNTNITSLNHLNISPNPSKGWLNMDISFNQIENYSIVIHDAVGKVAYSRNLSGNRLNEQLDISKLSNGVYFISIITGNESITKKFILAK